ncbi:MAG: helix-turn-helix transcriptional regulator [Bacteroidia bacterium]|nr:helix-turn-helix transcriptional regulator [Bacteroidia bacterium]
MSSAKLDKAATVLKAVAHPTRLKIVCLLGEFKKMSVTEISEKTACEQSLVSHHLTNLKAKKILEIKREGKNIYYSLSDRHLLNIIKCINNCKSI